MPRERFLSQKMFSNRGIDHHNLFDHDPELKTHFLARIEGRALRVDFGEYPRADRQFRGDQIMLRMRDRESFDLAPELHRFADDAVAEISPDLRAWVKLEPTWSGKGTIALLEIPPNQPFRYLRIQGAPRRIADIALGRNGRYVRSWNWRASNLLYAYQDRVAVAAWTLSFTLDEVPKHAVLAVPIAGKHGNEGAYAALRVDGDYVGAPDRAVSYPSNTWEYRNVETDSNYTYYFPLSESMAGRNIELVVLLCDPEHGDVKPEAWLTAYPIPFESHGLVLHEKP
jgi:hypothetical protein